MARPGHPTQAHPTPYPFFLKPFLTWKVKNGNDNEWLLVIPSSFAYFIDLLLATQPRKWSFKKTFGFFQMGEFCLELDFLFFIIMYHIILCILRYTNT